MLVSPGLFVWMVLCAADPVAAMDVQLPSGPHPCVFLTPEEAASVRQRVQSHEWAKSMAAGIIKSADSLVAAELAVPREGGQWSHWYTCKKDGGGLTAKSPTEHVCKTCGEVYSGWPYDQVYITYRHHHWLGGIETLGLAYLLDPKPEYAERAREILLTYASFYEGLSRHNVHGKDARPGGKLFAQTLDESCDLCRICVGYDLLYDAPCFSEDDHKTIAGHFLRPMVASIQTHPAGISNWQSWHNAGVASAAFVLRDAELVNWAVNDPKNGFLMQMDKSVLDNGMWYEGAPAYHWYALSAHVYLMEAAARAGMDLYAVPVVKRLFEGPVAQLYPDGTFPAIQDSGRSSIDGARRYYEVAYRRYHDPNFLKLIDKRDSWWALLWGADTLPEVGDRTLELATSNAPSQGLAILRDAANETAVFFDYGQKYGGHIHPAKLGLILFAHGNERLVDPGRLPYGNPIHREWYTTTVAHNTVVVNQESQKAAPAELVAFEANDRFSLVRAKCERAYPGVLLERTLFLHDDTLVDIFDCTSEDAVTFDLPMHLRAELSGIPEGGMAEAPGDVRGYMHFKEYRRIGEGVREFAADCGEGRRLHVTMLDDGDRYTAKGFGSSPRELLPLVMRRRQAKAHRFVTVVQMLGKEEQPKRVTRDEAGRVIVGEDGDERAGIALSQEDGKTVVAERGTQGAWTETTVSPVGE